jgi:predicted AAA+ superfamily ATPase
LLETYVLHELRAHLNRSSCGGQLTYWRTPAGSEVDFVWTRGATAVGIEVKATSRWRHGDGNVLTQLHAERKLQKVFGTYLGQEQLRDGPVRVLPFTAFLDALHAGKVIG